MTTMFAGPNQAQKDAFVARKQTLAEQLEEKLAAFKQHGTTKLPSVEMAMSTHPADFALDMIWDAPHSKFVKSREVSTFTLGTFLSVQLAKIGLVDVGFYRIEKIDGLLAFDHPVGFAYANFNYAKKPEDLICITMGLRVFLDQMLPDDKFADAAVEERFAHLTAVPQLMDALTGA